MNKQTVIADLGCGDAAIAKVLIPKGFCVLSYDLKSDGRYVVEADICKNLPLPGSEESSTGVSTNTDSDARGSGGGAENGGQVVDVVICALSLMNVNWVGCVKEVWRVLKPK